MSRLRHTLKQPDFGPGGPCVVVSRFAVAEKLLKSKIYIISSSVGLNSKERRWRLYLKMSINHRSLKSEIKLEETHLYPRLARIPRWRRMLGNFLPAPHRLPSTPQTFPGFGFTSSYSVSRGSTSL